jgi:hypothetical protein
MPKSVSPSAQDLIRKLVTSTACLLLSLSFGRAVPATSLLLVCGREIQAGFHGAYDDGHVLQRERRQSCPAPAMSLSALV